MSPPDPQSDCFKPPAIPTEVFCLHCQQEYESYLIHWTQEVIEGELVGFWCCPTPGCDGRGFGFDILPTDPEYRDEDGELMWDPGDEDDEEDDQEDEDWDVDDLFGPTLLEADEPLGDLPADPDRLRDLPRRLQDDDDIPF